MTNDHDPPAEPSGVRDATAPLVATGGVLFAAPFLTYRGTWPFGVMEASEWGVRAFFRPRWLMRRARARLLSPPEDPTVGWAYPYEEIALLVLRRPMLAMWPANGPGVVLRSMGKPSVDDIAKVAKRHGVRVVEGHVPIFDLTRPPQRYDAT